MSGTDIPVSEKLTPTLHLKDGAKVLPDKVKGHISKDTHTCTMYEYTLTTENDGKTVGSTTVKLEV